MAGNSVPNDNILLPASWRGFAPILAMVGFGALLISIGLCFTVPGSDPEASVGSTVFWRSYLANFIFCLSICLGALFFVMVQHLVRAGWSASIKRIAELFAFVIPFWALMFIPCLGLVWFGYDSLYPWATQDSASLSEIVQKKLDYLNPGFFTLRVIVYFAVWILCARLYFGLSRKQDETGEAELTLKMQRYAGPAIMLFALSVNFGAFDIMMSTDPAWFSTIYGVYLFAASMLSFFAMTILSCFLLQKNGRIQKLVTTEHFHDMSKFQFGFIVFWGYIAFSQFLLYWYGNIPEETTWYLHRMEHGWEIIGVLLIAFHFAIPFLGTMSRYVRRNKAVMAGWAGFILFVHWMDMLFLLMPSEQIPVSPMLIVAHLVCFVGMVCLFLAMVLLRVADTPLVAVKDPWLPDALAYQVGP